MIWFAMQRTPMMCERGLWLADNIHRLALPEAAHYRFARAFWYAKSLPIASPSCANDGNRHRSSFDVSCTRKGKTPSNPSTHTNVPFALALNRLRLSFFVSYIRAYNRPCIHFARVLRQFTCGSGCCYFRTACSMQHECMCADRQKSLNTGPIVC